MVGGARCEEAEEEEEEEEELVGLCGRMYGACELL